MSMIKKYKLDYISLLECLNGIVRFKLFSKTKNPYFRKVREAIIILVVINYQVSWSSWYFSNVAFNVIFLLLTVAQGTDHVVHFNTQSVQKRLLFASPNGMLFRDKVERHRCRSSLLVSRSAAIAAC